VPYEAVDIFVEDSSGNPIEGVVVKIFNVAGSITFSQQNTDSAGKASFLLFTQDYTMRFFKFQTAFTQPQSFTVEEGGSNQFTAVGSSVEPPAATDARLCRCSGYFRDSNGTAQQYLDMSFFSDFSPILLDGSAIIPRPVRVRTDRNGYAQIDLIRGGKYRVMIEAMECADRYIKVPDQASANLPDVLFPVVSSVSFDIDEPYTVAVGGELVLTPSVFDSAGVLLEGTGSLDVQWTFSDPTIASVAVAQNTLTITGLASGTTELQASRSDLSIIKIPNIPIEGQPVLITVT